MSNTGWTPAVPGHTNDLRRSDGGQQPTAGSAAPADDLMADQVVDLDVERDGDVVVVHITGEVDMLTTPALTSVLSEQLRTELSTLVLDMTGVGFLGSSGLAALVTARDEAGHSGVSLRLVSGDHAVLRPLAATGLTELFDIYPDVAAALAG